MQLKANLLMMTISMCWGMSYIFMVIGLESLAVFNAVALRSLIAFLIAGLIFYKRIMKVDKKTIYFAMIQGGFLMLSVAFPMYGVMTTPASNAGFLVSLTVVFVPIITSILERKVPKKSIIIAIVFTMIGISILTFNTSLQFQIGDLFCLLTAVTYSIYIVLNGIFTKSVDALAFGIYQMGFAMILSGLLCLMFETPTIPTTSSGIIAILGLGILCSAFGFIGQTVAQKYTTATMTGLIFSLEPVFAALFASIFLDEIITTKLIIGGILVLIGNVIAQVDHFNLSKFLLKHRHKEKTV